MRKPVLIVMAAGMGSRYGGLKQIDPVGDHGEIILDFSLYDAMLAGFEEVVFVIKKENEDAFRALVDDKAGKHLNIKYAFQDLADLPEGYEIPEGREKPWGTGHAVLSAREMIDGPFAVINADDYYGPGAFSTMYDFLEKAEDGEKYDYAMVGYMLSNTLTDHGTVARGVCVAGEDGKLAEIDERLKIKWAEDGSGKAVYLDDDGETWTEVPADSPVSMNFWGFTLSMMEELEQRFPGFLDRALAEDPMKGEYLLPFTVKELIEEGKAEVRILGSQDKWYGVTYKEDKPSVVSALQSMKDKGLYPPSLW